MDISLLLVMAAIGYRVEAFTLAGIVTPLTLLPAAITSVTYTTPASTLPVSTWVSTDFTSGWSVTGLTLIPAFLNTCAATTPQGTCGWHSATLTDDFARSLTDVTFPGLFGGTATSILFFAKFCGWEAFPALTTCCMFAGAAEANTSAGAPLLIWVARPELGPKLNFTVSPWWAASNCLPSWVKVPVSEAAAKTVIEPVEDEPPELDELEPLLLQPATATAASAAMARANRRIINSWAEPRQARSASLGDLDGDVGGLDGGDREHSRLEAEFIRRLAAEQRHEPVRPRLDLGLGHHGVAHHPGDQAAEPVPRRMRHHHPALAVVGRLGQVLREPGQRRSVHGEPSGGIGGRLDPSPVRP